MGIKRLERICDYCGNEVTKKTKLTETISEKWICEDCLDEYFECDVCKGYEEKGKEFQARYDIDKDICEQCHIDGN